MVSKLRWLSKRIFQMEPQKNKKIKDTEALKNRHMEIVSRKITVQVRNLNLNINLTLER